MTGDTLECLLTDAHMDRLVINKIETLLNAAVSSTIRACEAVISEHLSDRKTRASELIDTIRSDCEAAIERYMAEMRDLVPDDETIREGWADTVAEARTDARQP